jgi:RNA polymerase sigma factor (sigma-70 family)
LASQRQTAVFTLRDENQVLDRVLGGEQQAFALLVDAHKSYAYTIALKILNNRPEAEEAAQDSFIKAYQNLKFFNRQAKFSTWLYRIVFNTAISYKRKHRVKLDDIEKADQVSSKENGVGLEQADKSEFIQLALEKLSEADQLAIQLFYMKEFSLEEISGILNQPINTVKVRVHRARQRVGDELKKILREEALTL